MYDLKLYKYNTAEPWRVPFSHRLKAFMNAGKNGMQVVVYLYELADTSTFRYRAYNMCQVLQKSLSWQGFYFFKDELPYLKDYLEYINIMIVIRYRWDFELDAFLDMARQKKVKLVFDVDDLIYDSLYVPLVTNTLAVNMFTKEDYDYWFTYTGRIRSTALKCDELISTNGYIADILRQDFKKTCYIMPNFYNRSQEQASEYLCKQKQGQERKKPFIVGYFSGTPSHINDFLVVAPELRDLLNDCSDLILRIVGFMELPDYMRKLKEKGRIELIPLQNFIDLQKEIACVDINIIPLQDNKFCNCKSELKYFEAGIVETVSCATPTYVYKNIVQQGENGFLCNQGEWYRTVKHLYDDGIDKKILEKAKRFSYDNYFYGNQLKYLEDILNEIQN